MSIVNKLKNINIFSSKSAFDTHVAGSPIPDTELALAGCHVVVEAYSNGTSWYRKYSDGFIEQGGQVSSIYDGTTITVNLVTAMTTTTYAVQLAGDTITSTNNAGHLSYGTRNTTSFVVSYNATLANSTGFSWEIKGY